MSDDAVSPTPTTDEVTPLLERINTLIDLSTNEHLVNTALGVSSTVADLIAALKTAGEQLVIINQLYELAGDNEANDEVIEKVKAALGAAGEAMDPDILANYEAAVAEVEGNQ